MKKTIGILIAATLMSSAALAQTSTETFSPTINQAIYAKAGFPGIGLGYAYGFNKHFGLRGDITTVGSYSINETSGKLSYDGDLKYNQAGIYGDWFPQSGNFRVTAGLQFRDAKVRGNGKANSAGLIGIGDVEVMADAGDRVNAQIKFPTIAPYIGIGWGLNTAVNSPGWSFFADLGVTIGKPKVSMTVNDSLAGKLDAATGGNGQQEINKQIAELRKDANDIKIVPQLFVGVAYKF